MSWDTYQEDTKVPPLLACINVQTGKVLVSRTVLAVLAIGGSLRVEKIATGLLSEGAGVVHTRLAWRCVEASGFVGSTLHRQAMERCSEDTADPVGRWVHPVHPILPEDWK